MKRKARLVLQPQVLLTLAAWTAIVLLSAGWNVYQLHDDSHSAALIESRTYHRLSHSYRQWAAGVGGLYAAVQRVRPNPYLIHPGRDVRTTDGVDLTLVNPAYMTRLVFEIVARDPLPLRSRMTSLKPLNPANAPDEFEGEALQQFEGGLQEYSTITTIAGQHYLRFIKPVRTEPACLECHASQGYRVGDVRGGLSIAVPMAEIEQNEARSRWIILMTHFWMWALVAGGIVAVSGRRERQRQAVEESEWRFRTLAHAAEDWQFWIGEEQQVIFMTPSCEKVTGYAAAEYVADPDLIRRVVHPEDRDVWERHLADFRGPQHAELEIRIVSKDGQVKWMSHQCSPIFQGDRFLGRASRNQLITERKEAQEVLRRSEARLNEAQRLAHVGCWELDHRDGKLLWSEEIFRIFEIDPQVFPASYAAFLGAIHPEDRKLVDESFTSSVKNRTPYDITHRLRMGDGRIKHVRERCETFYDANGRPLRSIGAVQDITGLMRSTESLERQVKRLAALRAIDLAITASMDLRVTLDVVMEYVMAELKVDAVSILVQRQHLQALEYAGCKGFRTVADKATHIPLGRGFAGRVARSRELLVIPDLYSEEAAQEPIFYMQREGFASYCAAPLLAKGRVIGVIEVYQRRPFEPDRDWIEFFEALAGQTAIAMDSSQMFGELQRTTDDLVMAYDSTIEGWSRALDYRDKETEGHSRRVTEMTVKIAGEMQVRERDLVHVRRGALLHDIGKLGVPDAILFKPGKLDDAEWEIMRRHTRIAYDLLFPVEFLRPAVDIPFCHHEKWDGTGYPRGLKGEEIPFAARIFSVVDVYDALSSDRPYRPAWPKEKVLDYIRERAGTEFDPRVVEVFVRVARSW